MTPLISIELYFERFVNVILGVAVIFELPVAIFFLTLIHVASPSFLLRNSRYAILAIVILAAVMTPSPDAFNHGGVRRADDPAVLSGRFRELYAGDAPRKAEVSLEDVPLLGLGGSAWRSP